MRRQFSIVAVFTGLLALGDCTRLPHNWNRVPNQDASVNVVEGASTVVGQPAPTPSVCGESGEFTMDFDDLPPYTPENNDVDSFRPIFNPNTHLFFSGGWFYTPSTGIYNPTSGKYMAVFDPTKEAAPGSPYAGLVSKGGLGAGPRAYQKTFWFNVSAARLGCGDRAQDSSCVITISAVKYSAELEEEEVAEKVELSVPSCPEGETCRLALRELGDAYRGLSAIVFEGTVGGKPVNVFLDDLQMEWYDNSCEAGLERVGSR